MDILWDPEIATCTECGRKHVVRRYTSDGTHRVFCYKCWHKMQEEMELDDSEWVERNCIIMETETEQYKNGVAQEYSFH